VTLRAHDTSEQPSVYRDAGAFVRRGHRRICRFLRLLQCFHLALQPVQLRLHLLQFSHLLAEASNLCLQFLRRNLLLRVHRSA
jgi:hypothetical protein